MTSNKKGLDETMCEKCEEKPAQPLHNCPYSTDVYDDYSVSCNCCSECTYQCCMDI